MEDTQVEPRLKTLKNGAIYDLDKGRIVSSVNVTTKITPERSVEMQSRRQELKQQRIMAGAAKTLERSGDWETPNDMDVVEAIAEAVMMNALNPDSKKQIDAAKFILTEAGLSSARERGGSDVSPNAITAPPAALAELLDIIDRRQAAAIDKARAVDVVATDTRNDNE